MTALQDRADALLARPLAPTPPVSELRARSARRRRRQRVSAALVGGVALVASMGVLAARHGDHAESVTTSPSTATSTVPTTSTTPTSARPTSTTPTSARPTSSVTTSTAPAPTSTTNLPIDTAIEVYNCASPSVEPSEIVLTCADKGWRLEELHWMTWTPEGATAVGVFLYNDCTPYCALGHIHSVPGTHVVLSVPVRGAGGQLVWSRLQQDPLPPGYSTGPEHGAPFRLPTRPN